MENMSLFDLQNDTSLLMNEFSTSGTLDVIKMDFIEAETMSWKELFSGFDKLHAITYSSGINFIYQLLEMFQEAEIIFGCEEIMSYSLQEVMAYQCKLIERMRESASKIKLDLISRIEDNTLHFLSLVTCFLMKNCTFCLLLMDANASLWALQICPLMHSAEINVKTFVT